MGKLKNIPIIDYSKKEDLFNSVSHFFGVLLGITILVISFVFYFQNKIGVELFIGDLVFGLSAIALYFVSGLYHIYNPEKETTKRVLRIIDHCTIYALIAGTYTPICIYIMSVNPIGLVMLILQWVLAAIGITLNAISLNNKYIKIISMILYLFMGWMVIFFWAHIYISLISFYLILAGGVAYTIGSVLYGFGHKKLIFHSVFHIFVLIGTILQAIGIFYL